MSRKENYSFLFWSTPSIEMEIRYLQEAESWAYCLLLQKTHVLFEDRSDLEEAGLNL